MRIVFPLIIITLSSCASLNHNGDMYETAYNNIIEKKKYIKPYWNKYGSDASGIKIIPRIYKYKSIYEDINLKKDFENSKTLKKLSKKYSNKNWRKDSKYGLLMPNEIKNFHGPIGYIYFTEIKNDTLKAQILNNPNGEYKFTTGENFIIVFKDGKIISFTEWNNHYD